MQAACGKTETSRKRSDAHDRDLSGVTAPNKRSSKYKVVEDRTILRMKSEALVEIEHQRMIAERLVKDQYRSATDLAHSFCHFCTTHSHCEIHVSRVGKGFTCMP